METIKRLEFFGMCLKNKLFSKKDKKQIRIRNSDIFLVLEDIKEADNKEETDALFRLRMRNLCEKSEKFKNKENIKKWNILNVLKNISIGGE